MRRSPVADLTGLHDEHSLKAQVAPPLSELCVRIIAQNFSNRPTLRGIPTRYIDRVTELLPTTLPLDVTGPLIDDEGYWQRCATARWDNCQISDHGSSWKRLYFERNLTDFLEAFDPKQQDTEELTRTLAISKACAAASRRRRRRASRSAGPMPRRCPLALCSGLLSGRGVLSAAGQREPSRRRRPLSPTRNTDGAPFSPGTPPCGRTTSSRCT